MTTAMGVVSVSPRVAALFLRHGLDWLTEQGPFALKHRQLAHPWIVLVLHYAVVSCVTLFANNIFNDFFQPGNNNNNNKQSVTTGTAPWTAFAVWCYAIFRFLFRYFVVAPRQWERYHCCAFTFSHNRTTKENNNNNSNNETNSREKINHEHGKGNHHHHHHHDETKRVTSSSSLSSSAVWPTYASNLYGSTFLCNVTLVLGPLGLYDVTYRRITHAYCIAVGIDQLLWGLDVSIGLLTGGAYFPFGVSKYLFFHPPKSSSCAAATASTTLWVEWVTPWHHVWTIPVFLQATAWSSMHYSSYLLSLIVIAINVALSRWLTPESILIASSSVSSSFSSLSSCTNGNSRIYLNVNLAHELWSDVKIPILQVINRYKADAKNYMVAFLWRWSFFNLLVFWFLQWWCEFMQLLQSSPLQTQQQGITA